MEAQPGPIKLNSRVVVELVDSSGEAERREFTIVPTRQADFNSSKLCRRVPPTNTRCLARPPATAAGLAWAG